jgi:hypothetical protein
MGFEQPLFRALCALSSSTGGPERDGSDIVSVEGAAMAILRLSEVDLAKDAWAAALTAEAAMLAGALDIAEAVARRAWFTLRKIDPPETVFAALALARVLQFQRRLHEVSLLAPHVEAVAQRHGLRALHPASEFTRLFDALSGRHDELTRRAATIDELAPQCARVGTSWREPWC